MIIWQEVDSEKGGISQRSSASSQESITIPVICVRPQQYLTYDINPLLACRLGLDTTSPASSRSEFLNQVQQISSSGLEAF
jgi:hypothetical protein